MPARCRESLSGQHIPDEVELISVDETEETAKIIFFCEVCGTQGSLVVSLTDVEWEADGDDETSEIEDE